MSGHMSSLYNRNRTMNIVSSYKIKTAVSIFLAVISIAVYFPAKDYDFVTFDDYDYVADNANIKKGFTSENLSCIFTDCAQKGGAILWHPLTWLSLMIDYKLYGLNAGGYHITNLVFHVLNTLLLFLVLGRMTGAVWRSALVAALFALHPLHVESVAWVSERKDVLSTFFGFLAIFVYILYVEKPGKFRYAILLIFFSLSLTAKSMLVTLPFLFLLLDCWPLGRLNPLHEKNYVEQINADAKGKRIKRQKQDRPMSANKEMPETRSLILFRRLLWEKIPLLVISAAFCVVTYYFHAKIKQINISVSFVDRLGNAVVSYASYILKVFWPFDLAVLYPFQENLPVWQIAGTLLLISSLTAGVVYVARKLPYLAVGWFWYLGTLIPVIGIVQVGMQAMADRYTYFPIIGLFIMLVWGISDVAAGWRYRTFFLAFSSGAVILSMAVLTSHQLTYWKNGISLWQRTLQVTRENHKAHYCLASTYLRSGDYQNGIAQMKEAIRISPYNAEYFTMIGTIYGVSGRTDKAVESYYEALKNDSDFDKAHYNLALMLLDKKQHEKALEHLKEAIRINPARERVRLLIGNILVHQSKIREAISVWEEEIRIRPNNPDLCNDLGSAYYIMGDWKKAVACYRKALLIDPGNSLTKQNLAVIQKKFGNQEDSSTCP